MSDNAKGPIGVALKAGQTYFWCRCGHSEKQPLCDGSHIGSGIQPMKCEATDDGEVFLCTCKHTKMAPFCDGSHNDVK